MLAGLFEEAGRHGRKRKFRYSLLLLVVLAAAVTVIAINSSGPDPAGSGSGGAAAGHTTASNRAAATADARALLAMVRVPSGSRLAEAPHVPGFDESQDFIGVSASATASRTWVVHDRVDRLLRFVVAHLHPGSSLDTSGGSGPNAGEEDMQIRSWPPVAGVLDGRWLQLQVYSDGTRTYLTARSQSQWVITRQASERIPHSVTKITIRVTDLYGHTKHQLVLTKPRIVHKVVALYNSLGVIQPAITTGCPRESGGVLTLRFYDSPTNVVATANSAADADPHWPASAAEWACFPIQVKLAQHSFPSLSGNVITPLAKLVDSKLNP